MQFSETQYATIAFVDLSGSTSVGEALQDNQLLLRLLDRWQRITSYILCNYGGLIGASDSDSVMGYFKGVETDTLASSRAILAAKHIRDETIRFGQEFHAPLDVHIGIHCGKVEVGKIGPESRCNLTTIGQPVNIAARIEKKANRGEIFVSERIKNETRICLEGNYAGEYELKGVKEPMKCYRIQSVGFQAIHKDTLNQSEWIFATLESQALHQIGRDTDSLELAKKAACSPNALTDLNPKLILVPLEICIWNLLSLNRPNEAEDFIHQYAKYAADLSSQLECANADFYLAENLMLQKKYEEAIVAYDMAKLKYDNCGDRRKIADSLFYLGVAFQRLGDSKKAAQRLDEAKKEYLYFIDNQVGTNEDIGKACLELSILLIEDPKVMKYLALAIKKFEYTCQFRFLIRALNNMSYVCNSRLLPTDAENYARRALILASDFDPISGTIMALENLGISIENRCNLGSIPRRDIRDALIEASNKYQQALELTHKVGDEDLAKKFVQYIQRINIKLMRLNFRS